MALHNVTDEVVVWMRHQVISCTTMHKDSPMPQVLKCVQGERDRVLYWGRFHGDRACGSKAGAMRSADSRRGGPARQTVGRAGEARVRFRYWPSFGPTAVRRRATLYVKRRQMNWCGKPVQSAGLFDPVAAGGRVMLARAGTARSGRRSRSVETDTAVLVLADVCVNRELLGRTAVEPRRDGVKTFLSTEDTEKHGELPFLSAEGAENTFLGQDGRNGSYW